jgi:hypothetical protein
VIFFYFFNKMNCQMWIGMTTCIRKVALEEFGVTKGGKREAKET